MVRPGIYIHAQGGRYEVLGVGINPNTQKEMVIYRQQGKKWEWCTRDEFEKDVEIAGAMIIKHFTYFSELSQDFMPSAELRMVMADLM